MTGDPASPAGAAADPREGHTVAVPTRHDTGPSDLARVLFLAGGGVFTGAYLSLLLQLDGFLYLMAAGAALIAFGLCGWGESL